MKLQLLQLSAGKQGKVLLTGGPMLLSVIAYAFVFGWRYAAGFVGLLFIHEMGHCLATRQRRLDVGAPTFIPFVGAWETRMSYGLYYLGLRLPRGNGARHARDARCGAQRRRALRVFSHS